MRLGSIVLGGCISVLIAGDVSRGACPQLNIFADCPEAVPLYEALPANETFVTCLICRPGDDLIIGATCGKKQIGLFGYNHRSGEVKRLDLINAPWWDEPVIAPAPDGGFYLGAKRVHDKQYVFERLRERADTPDAIYHRRFQTPPASEINEDATGMPIRHYGPDGKLVAQYPLPPSMAKDGVRALLVGAGGKMLYGLSSPGGRFFTVALPGGEAKDYGAVVRFPSDHHTRRIDRILMEGLDGKIYFTGLTPVPDYRELEGKSDDSYLGRLACFDPATGEFTAQLAPEAPALLGQRAELKKQLESLEKGSAEEIKQRQGRIDELKKKIAELDTRLDLAGIKTQLPAITGRHRLAAIDAAIRLADGTYVGGTTDGYLFRFDPKTVTVTPYGKPLRQQHIVGLGVGPEGLIYGIGGERLGLPRLFVFDLTNGALRPGHCANAENGNSNAFGAIGGAVCTSDGTLIVGEYERRGHLLIYRPPGAEKPK